MLYVWFYHRSNAAKVGPLTTGFLLFTALQAFKNDSLMFKNECQPKGIAKQDCGTIKLLKNEPISAIITL
jgi:hypothetical protein